MITYEIAQVWADDLLAAMYPDSPQAKARRAARERRAAELAWLRQSMDADAIPEHIQALVIERWKVGE